MQQEKKRFVNRLDYRTSPGYLEGGTGCREAGLREGEPSVVITNMAFFRFDGMTGEMYLAEHYPGVAIQEIVDNMEFSVDVSRAQRVAPRPRTSSGSSGKNATPRS